MSDTDSPGKPDRAGGIFEADRVFGHTITLSSGRAIPVRWIGEQHVVEDCGHIPSLSDWLRCIRPEPWMNRPRKLARELDSVRPAGLLAMSERPHPNGAGS